MAAFDAGIGSADLAQHFDIVYLPLGAAAYGGAERSLLELAGAQAQAGSRVLVCFEAALAATDFVRDARALGLPLHPVDWSPEAGPSAVATSAVRLFSALRADIVQFNISWRPHMWLVPVAARLCCRARLLGTMRALPDRYGDAPRRSYFGLFQGPPLRMWLELLLGRIWARALHQTVSVNRDDYPPRLVGEFGFARRRLAVIYNGVRLADAAPSAERKARARAALGVSPEAFVLAYVGRVSTEKGIRYAIEALAQCDRRVQLLIAGDGGEIDALRARVAELELGERVRLLGYCADPAPVFIASDAVVVPSLWNEAFGRVVVEAMGCARPVIATTVGGMQELFEDGRQGFMVPKADAGAIARAVGRWVDDAALCASMSAAARELALNRYSTTRVAAEYAQLYGRLRRG